MNAEDGYLALSGVQHFAFCRRQWALIHIEQAWSDNALTALGDIMHERTHSEEIKERRGSMIIARGLRVHSSALGLSGICDVVEFHQDAKGCPLSGEDGLWRAIPVEYKRGKSKTGDEDRLQLLAQAICLEEMLGCDIPVGYLYYGRTKSRERVVFDERLRERLRELVGEMHQHYARGYTPRVRRFSGCRSCSLAEVCLPETPACRSVGDYLARTLEEES